MAWSVQFINAAVEAEVEALPDDMQARLIRVKQLIEAFGLTALREPHVKHLTGKLWEIRLKRTQRNRSCRLAASLSEEDRKDSGAGNRDRARALKGDQTVNSFESYQRRALKKPGIRAEYDRLAHEFAVARTLIAARMAAKLTQDEVARRMGTSQSAVARMESGRSLPSTSSLVKYAEAVGRKLTIGLS